MDSRLGKRTVLVLYHSHLAARLNDEELTFMMEESSGFGLFTRVGENFSEEFRIDDHPLVSVGHD
jgi:hypothetical protein